jgi:hypothetical protein
MFPIRSVRFYRRRCGPRREGLDRVYQQDDGRYCALARPAGQAVDAEVSGRWAASLPYREHITGHRGCGVADSRGSRKSLLEYLLNIGIDGESRRFAIRESSCSWNLILLPVPTPSTHLPDLCNPLSTARPSRADLSGVITDYPHEFRRSLERKNYPLAPPGDAKRVLKCLEKHNQYTADKLDGKGY